MGDKRTCVHFGLFFNILWSFPLAEAGKFQVSTPNAGGANHRPCDLCSNPPREPPRPAEAFAPAPFLGFTETPLRRPVLANHLHPSTPGKPGLSCRSCEPMSLATHLWFPLGCRLPPTHLVPPLLFRTASTACSRYNSRTCFIPLPTMGFTALQEVVHQSEPSKEVSIWPVHLFPHVLLPFKGLLLLQRRSVSPRPCALLLLLHSRSTAAAESEDPTLHIHHRTRTKLQGFVR